MSNTATTVRVQGDFRPGLEAIEVARVSGALTTETKPRR